MFVHLVHLIDLSAKISVCIDAKNRRDYFVRYKGFIVCELNPSFVVHAVLTDI